MPRMPSSFKLASDELFHPRERGTEGIESSQGLYPPWSLATCKEIGVGNVLLRA